MFKKRTIVGNDTTKWGSRERSLQGKQPRRACEKRGAWFVNARLGRGILGAWVVSQRIFLAHSPPLKSEHLTAFIPRRGSLTNMLQVSISYPSKKNKFSWPMIRSGKWNPKQINIVVPHWNRFVTTQKKSIEYDSDLWQSDVIAKLAKRAIQVLWHFSN